MLDTSTLPDENTFRFVAVLNKKIEAGRLMNALGHMTAGLAGGFGKGAEMCFLEYKDKNDTIHPNISHFPYIVLAADNSNKIRSLRAEAIAQGILFTDFTSTMTIGTSEEQVTNTRNTPELDLEYFGICMFGSTNQLKELTKKFSLYR
jgi:hypothetical protein